MLLNVKAGCTKITFERTRELRIFTPFHLWRYSPFWALAFHRRRLHSSLSSVRLLLPLIPRTIHIYHLVLCCDAKLVVVLNDHRMIKQADKCIMGLSAIPRMSFSFLFGTTAPTGQGLLIHIFSRSHSTTHHSL